MPRLELPTDTTSKALEISAPWGSAASLVGPGAPVERIMGKDRGKSWENHGKSWEKTWENHGESVNYGKNFGKFRKKT